MSQLFKTRKEAEIFAVKRRKGFREMIKQAERDKWYSSSPKRLKARQDFLKESIKTVKVKKVMNKSWAKKGWKPMYEVVGR